MDTRPSKPLTLKQGLFLALLVPTFLLAIIELSARGILLLKGEEKANGPMALEMPTWMLNDANAIAKRPPSSDAVDWLNLFQEGPGFRVHLIPNIRKEVRNTFSLIPADASRRYMIEANSLGFRGPELTKDKAQSVFRILVFGDSSSFGWGVNAEDSWSVLLQKFLQERYPQRKIEVANFAIPGDSSAYGKLLFEKFAPQFKSDLVIFGFGANDAKPVLTSHTAQVSRFSDARGLLAVAGILRLSAVYRLLEKLATPSPSPADIAARPRVPAVTEADYSQNLRTMGQQARTWGNKNSMLLALCTPNNYARRARGVARQEGFLWFNGQNKLIKLLPLIEKGEVYTSYVQRMRNSYPEELQRNKMFYITSDGCHPNELGHRFVADNLTTLVQDSGLIN